MDRSPGTDSTTREALLQVLTEAALRKGLETEKLGSKIYTFETIDSTNSCARALAEVDAPEGTVVIAEQQTAGKGRLGRTWLANPGENLTFSLILRPGVDQDTLNLLPLYVAVAVAQAVERAAPVRVECKWPNDLLIRKKKFAGILLESSVKNGAVEYVVLGVGVNVNQREFPDGFVHPPTSLRLEAGRETDRAELFRTILASLESLYLRLAGEGFHGILPLWLERSAMVDHEITVAQGPATFSGRVKGLSREGGLVLDVEGGERVFFAGDVTIIQAT